MNKQEKQKIVNWMVHNCATSDLLDDTINQFKAQMDKTKIKFITDMCRLIEQGNKEFEKQRIPFLLKMIRG